LPWYFGKNLTIALQFEAMIRYFVAATSQHVGKTTSTLGLVKAFQSKGFHTGYCKPVGQQALTWQNHHIDKDALLFARSMHFDLEASLHSPVILGPGATTDYIDDPEQYHFPEKILYAAQRLEQQYEAIIYEGTGHPGVGSVVDLSNARVARMVNAHVILIVEGGIGSTIDELNMSSALFREEGVPIAGVIVNKVKPSKLDKVRQYLEKRHRPSDPPILGYLPFDGGLANPIMDTIAQAIKGEVILNQNSLDNPVEHVMAGSLIDTEELARRRNILLVSSNNRLGATLRKLMDIQSELNMKECPLAGIIITGDGYHASKVDIPAHVENYIQQNQVPVVSTLFDTYGSAIKISRIEVKINLKTPWKVKLAEEMIRRHVNLDRLFTVPVRS
jgi:dethiobiotin synthetase